MDHIELHRGGREEAFPETAEDWPYIAERAEFARYPGNSVPWHWHSEVELFYMEQGAIDYRTRAAHEHVRFEEGSAGFINGGVLHSTLQSPNSAPAIQMLLSTLLPVLPRRRTVPGQPPALWVPSAVSPSLVSSARSLTLT